MDELVSVLIPLYNHEKYIDECLNSIKNQTYHNLELIIINDGSSDNSEKIVKQWIENNPNLNIKYISQENQGITKTLNKMIGLSKGEYITLCASDDVLTEQSIEKRVEFLKLNPMIEACIGDANVIGTNSEFVNESAMISLYRANYKRLADNIVNELILNWSIVGPTFLAKKSLYENVGMYDENLLVEDREFYLRLLANNLLGFIPKIVAKYRVHTSNISRKSKTAKWNIYHQIAISNLKHSDRFKSFNKLFLKSHTIDIYITNLEYGVILYYILNSFRLIRRVFFRIYLVFSK